MAANLNIDPRKMALIKEFQNMSKGKKTDDMLPLVMALSKKSNSMGIHFNKEEMQMIIEGFKGDMAPAEKKQFESMMSMISMFGM